MPMPEKLLAILTVFAHNAASLAVTVNCNGDCIGPLATIRCKPRQVRKGATVAADSCAEMWLV